MDKKARPRWVWASCRVSAIAREIPATPATCWSDNDLTRYNTRYKAATHPLHHAILAAPFPLDFHLSFIIPTLPFIIRLHSATALRFKKCSGTTKVKKGGEMTTAATFTFEGKPLAPAASRPHRRLPTGYPLKRPLWPDHEVEVQAVLDPPKNLVEGQAKAGSFRIKSKTR